MHRILFFDTEISAGGRKLLDIGAVSETGPVLHSARRSALVNIAAEYDFLCGHNIFAHDLKYIGRDLERARQVSCGSGPVSVSQVSGKGDTDSVSQAAGGDDPASGSDLSSQVPDSAGSASGSSHSSEPCFEYIDTLLLSPLLFPSRPYHRLLKDDRLATDEISNPVNDAAKARDLFYDEEAAYLQLDPQLQAIYHGLLSELKEFRGFFKYVDSKVRSSDFENASLAGMIHDYFRGNICENAPLKKIIEESPVELAYCLSLLNSVSKPSSIVTENSAVIAGTVAPDYTDSENAAVVADTAYMTSTGTETLPGDANTADPDSADNGIMAGSAGRGQAAPESDSLQTGKAISRCVPPPWVSNSYPAVSDILNRLCNTPCGGCEYCRTHFDIHSSLKAFFGYDNFRTYDGQPLQEDAVRCAVGGGSLLAVFPTGGGKSLTFQLPALIAGQRSGALTVVLSPLQSLMKDQVDNLRSKGIIDAVTINGSLDPVERQAAIEMVENGTASLLYISPESLRSSSIERLLTTRSIARFVIDEAHCFSAWGQDFRVDYMYIGPFLSKLRRRKHLAHPIPVSCFTATAKQKVISDIRAYFRKNCGVDLELFASSAERTNLRYEVICCDDEESKYQTLRELITSHRCPSIVYVSRTRRTFELARRLTADGIAAVPYHGQMPPSDKHENQEAFMSGAVDVIVATTAFGMGIDKDDVGLIVHYNISTSLEDYIQEAGRAGRNPEMEADCYVLFNDNDLDLHFRYLNETKLSIGEIRQIWRAVKRLSGRRGRCTRTPLEISREAGWDDSSPNMETKVKAAVAALEQAGYVTRGNNAPLVYASGITVRSMQEASARIRNDMNFSEQDQQLALMTMSYLISRKSHSRAGNEDAESRVDYIADRLGVTTESIMNIVIRLREEGLLDDAMDMSAVLDSSGRSGHAEQILREAAELERFLADELPDGQTSLKALNSIAVSSGHEFSTVRQLRRVLLYWMSSGYLRKTVIRDGTPFTAEPAILRDSVDSPRAGTGRTHGPVMLRDAVRERIARRVQISAFIIRYLYHKFSGRTEVPFSVLELETQYNSQLTITAQSAPVSSKEIMGALRYLSAIGAMDLDGGFLVLYNAMQIERKVTDNKIQYKKKDYSSLAEHYKQRVRQIHIAGEFAHLMVKDYEQAMEFVRDYFAMDYMLFTRKYFYGGRNKEINRAITPERYNRLFDTLSSTQRKIIDDDSSQHIVVAAGPGSGKTKVLVHKLASLLLLEDVRRERLLMLTFSRSAASEFRRRLAELIGDAAYYTDIRTFHSFSFDLLGQMGSLEDSADIVSRAAELIRSGDADPSRINRSVLVIDEAQDMDENEFSLVRALMEYNEDMRVIAVGDDDQNIYEFRNSDSGYMRSLITDHGAVMYELTDNFRSDRLIVDFANSWADTIGNRMKTGLIRAVSRKKGSVSVTRYREAGLCVPAVELIAGTYKGGSCCVMTATNEEAMLMTGLLNRRGLKARLIQSSDGFDLYNLYEVRSFLHMLGYEENALTERYAVGPGSASGSEHSKVSTSNIASVPVISDDMWNQAVRRFSAEFAGSSCRDEVLRMIRAFEQDNRKKYFSDFIEYLHESKLEDFALAEDTISDSSSDASSEILVSTIHKSKGREFDSVYMVLSGTGPQDDAARRAVYVGVTRARHSLYIACNTGAFSRCSAAGVMMREDIYPYPAPDEAMLQLTHRGVNLGYFKYVRARIMKLCSGHALEYSGGELYQNNPDRRVCVCRLSKSAQASIASLENRGLSVSGARVRYILYWKGKDDEAESLIILPDIHFQNPAFLSSSIIAVRR